ncbi:helix-turn-helix domain-containing protein [Fictibacillus terranigra]|uniref:Helix-turn-helix domain-containing protein n=1 Tax=Fictibacillus terranigra TaxID=3058424 RepID=A0ABT8EDX2_9BACL|nr:helix-turn-helix domain-containing protein [Fictibacillus sp. CENA-BCM004]MDN4076120.1 helix-turn-helix domain-containing protein [Fictibacillus sp. CENA-BCM004]
MVGQRIRYYRKTKGLTQEELAQGICSVSYLSKIEKGDAKSSEEVINLLCERLGISAEEVDSNEILEMLNEWNLMIVNRRFEEAEKLYQENTEKVKIVHDPQIILRYELFLIRYYLISQPPNLELAIKYLKKIKSLHEQLSSELKFYYYLFTGMYYNLVGNYKTAVQNLHKAENLNKLDTSIKEIEIAVLYYLIALNYSYLMRISAVNTYAYKALTIFDKEYNFSRSADCQILIAISFRRANNYAEAEYHLNQALKYSLPFNDSFASGVIYHNLGYVASCTKEHLKAIDFFKKSLLHKNNDLPERKASTFFLLAQEYYKLNNYKETKHWIDKGFEVINRNKDEDLYYHLRITSYKLEGMKAPEFETFMSKEAIPFFERKNIWEYVSSYSELLADWYFEQSQYKKASQYYRIANNSRKNIY